MRIKFIQIILAFFLFCPALLFGQWEAFKNFDGRFELRVPGEMELKVDTLETAVGELAYHTFYLQSADDHQGVLLFMLSYCDYPPGGMHSDSLALLPDFFSTTIDASAESVKGEVLYQDSISMGDFPGRFWRTDYLEGAATIKTKAFLVGSRFYTLQAFMKKDYVLTPESDTFLNSFRLLE